MRFLADMFNKTLSPYKSSTHTRPCEVVCAVCQEDEILNELHVYIIYTSVVGVFLERSGVTLQR